MSFLLVGCQPHEKLTTRYWGIQMPPNARLIKSIHPSLFSRSTIITQEYELKEADFERMISNYIGSMPKPEWIPDYETGFLDYNFSSSDKMLLFSIKREPKVFSQIICDKSSNRIILMRQDL
jgi:hypothetical protein